MGESLTIEVTPDSGLTKNGLRKSNWRTSRALRKKAREDAFILGYAEKPSDWETPSTANVEIVQYYARRPMDYDGLACAVAPSIDGLVDCGILADDDPKHILSYSLSHEKFATMAENRVSITVIPVCE